MKETNSDDNKEMNRTDQHRSTLEPQVILSLLIKYWYYFVVGISISLVGARVYIRHTMPVYQSTTTILIKETGERTMTGSEDLLLGMGLSGGMRNLENQIMILASRALTEKALKELPFETEFYYKTIQNKISVYPSAPVKILFGNKGLIPRDIEFGIEFLDGNRFNLTSDLLDFRISASYGEEINVNGSSLIIELRDEEWVRKNTNRELFFIINSPESLVSNFNSRLNVELISRTGSLLRVSISGPNRDMDVDFLNKLAEVFQAISLDKKNIEAIRRIQFIDDQLIGISDSLQITESKLQQFRSSHRVMDLSVQGQAIIEQVTILENEKARLNLEANYYDYLADYLAKDVTGEMPIVPITMGITDPGLTRLVTELADLQGQLASRRTGELNPLQNLLAQRVNSTKSALLETLNGLRRANSLARSENQDQINRVNSQASALPVTERQLLGIERKFRLNDEMYTFLLQTRAEQQMQKASNTADSEVIDRADVRYTTILSPNVNTVLLISIFLGFAVPLLIVLLRFLLNNKIYEEDISRLTDIPVIGSIPHTSDSVKMIVFESPNSSAAEAYRMMRSKMQFFTKDKSSPVILITSSMPEEGKTFTAINLASVYSILGKKTILIGFDLRKPNIYKDFGLTNERGLSTYIIGNNKLEDIILKTGYDNLYVIPAGPVPPNPSELIALDRTKELFALLRERFDVIIVDSSPIGVVSDSFHLASLADTCLLVVRPGITLKDMLDTTLREIDSNQIRGLSLVLNDVDSGQKHYRYGRKYGYTSESEQNVKKSIFKQKRNSV